jgi:hypothetical protein
MLKPSLLASLSFAFAGLCLLTTACSAQAPAASPQQTMNNDAILKLNSSGLSEDLIVQTINATPGHYDTSTDALIALKQAGLTDKEIAAMLLRNSNTSPNPTLTASLAPAATPASVTADAPLDPNAKPRLFLQSESHGTNIKARRDQSMEMSKDFEKNCPAVRISINPAMADYTVMLNHIENDFSRDNQIQIADKTGDLISRTKEGGTINANVKKACSVIVADWARKTAPPAPPSPTPGS